MTRLGPFTYSTAPTSRASAAQRRTSVKRAVAARLPPGAVVVAAGACHDGAIQTRVFNLFFFFFFFLPFFNPKNRFALDL